MKGLTVLVVLIAVAGFVSSAKCVLKLNAAQEKKLTPFQKKVVDKLSLDIKNYCSGYDCRMVNDSDADVAVEMTRKTGCRCHKDDQYFGCRCCFRMGQWSYLVCVGAALELDFPNLFSMFTTIENKVFTTFTAPVKDLADKYIPVCVPSELPPPVEWLSPCSKFKFEAPSKVNGYVWRICGRIKIGIYVVPIWTFRMKCFQIPQTANSMMIEGQTNFDQDVEPPAVVDVSDGRNVVPVVCMSNARKEEAFKCRLGITPDELCPKPNPPIYVNKQVNWQVSKSEQSPFLVRLYVDNPLIPIEEYHGDDGYEFLTTLVAEVGVPNWMDNALYRNDYPGVSCGGVLLSPNKVLTNCACVRSFYAARKLALDVNVFEDYLYDMTASEIYLKFTDPFQDGYGLDPDGSKMIAKSKCTSEIAAGTSAEVLQTLMIAMPITPDFETTKRAGFLKWPPKVLRQQTVVNLVAYGLVPVNPDWYFEDDSGDIINFDNTAVDFFMKLCGEETKHCLSVSPKDQSAKGRLRCLCVKVQGSQLVHGEIGYPVAADLKLFGLNSLPVDNGTEGSTLITIFDIDTKKEIEGYVDNLVKTASTRSSSMILILSTIAAHCHAMIP